MRKCVCSRAFLMSFFCTVLVLLFVFGMLMVDAEGRRLSFNDNAPQKMPCTPARRKCCIRRTVRRF